MLSEALQQPFSSPDTRYPGVWRLASNSERKTPQSQCLLQTGTSSVFFRGLSTLRRCSLAGVWGAPAPTKLRLNHKPVTAPLFLPLSPPPLVSPVPLKGESKITQLSIFRSVSQHQLKDRAKSGVSGMFERDPAEVFPTIRSKKVTSVSRTTGRPIRPPKPSFQQTRSRVRLATANSLGEPASQRRWN